MPQEKPRNPFKTNLEEYSLRYAETSGKGVTIFHKCTRLSPSHNSQYELTPAPNKISIKIQLAERIPMPN